MNDRPNAPLRRAGILWLVAAVLGAVGAILDHNAWLGLGALVFGVLAWMNFRATSTVLGPSRSPIER